jgi:hypothetical protein
MVTVNGEGRRRRSVVAEDELFCLENLYKATFLGRSVVYMSADAATGCIEVLMNAVADESKNLATAAARPFFRAAEKDFKETAKTS